MYFEGFADSRKRIILPPSVSAGRSPSDETSRWASRIATSMRQSFAATIETGRLLIEAKSALRHGEWLPMLQKVPLNPRVAQGWMKLARTPRFANASPDSLLPASPKILAAIARLPEDDYQRLLADGSINPAVTSRIISGALRKVAQSADEKRVRMLAPVEGKFSTLLIDPPWESGGGWGCSYATMSQEELLELPVPSWLHDDAHVYLCALDSEIQNGFALLRRWNVDFKQMLAWNKTNVNGTPRSGNGYYFRNNAEWILFGVCGVLRTRSRSIGKSFDAPVPPGHSVKPDALYDIVKQMSYPNFGEVFQRKAREGFVNLSQPIVRDSKAAA
jgi:N6-adenosine-specific RNA methylase IME4